jgi:hypothetical protein
MRLLYCSSKNAISGNASNFEQPLTRTLSVADGGRFRIDQLRLGVAFMLVNANNRNLYFYEGPNARSAQLEIGQYDSQSLTTTLAFVMNAANGMMGRVTCAYSVVSACTVLTYTPPANHPDWQFSLATDDVVQQWPGIEAPKSFTSVLGGYITTMNGSSSILTFRFISTQPYDVIYLCSRRLGDTAIQGPRGSSDTLMQIVINQPFGSVQEASMPVDVWISCEGLTCHRLDFQLQDSAGNLVDMSLGGDVSFLLSIDDGNS